VGAQPLLRRSGAKPLKLKALKHLCEPIWRANGRKGKERQVHTAG